ncbi:MAG TPA: class I SAM-dependent methyltransferase [Deltaproteobacteria bacterium]|nr:class I SAM-dependent methyltransferase [Deltaproteobacteria bacterium]HOM28397.1 class I SAM-dependent methyltransferase [Deltaproteobacteria bacterium]HPP81335.1 class I SAM-dependent methyltransferase [Deltaproteobacteria bacterium]
MQDRYRFIGPLYDLLAAIFSLGKIDRCKCAHHDRIASGTKVLFAGVGQGVDAIEAAKRGGDVTVVDISQTMLSIFKKRTDKMGLASPIRIVHSDIFAFDEYERYDMVFANFFLNVFPLDTVLRLERHLASLAKPGGCVVVGDFCLPSGGAAARFFQNLYWYIADVVFYLAARNAIHPVYDYCTHLKDLGLAIEQIKYFRVLFDDRYYSILARKP